MLIFYWLSQYFINHFIRWTLFVHGGLLISILNCLNWSVALIKVLENSHRDISPY